MMIEIKMMTIACDDNSGGLHGDLDGLGIVAVVSIVSVFLIVSVVSIVSVVLIVSIVSMVTIVSVVSMVTVEKQPHVIADRSADRWQGN